MDITDFTVYFWLLPATLFILLPLTISFLWVVIKLPVSLLMREIRIISRKADPQTARQENLPYQPLIQIFSFWFQRRGVTPLAPLPLYCAPIRQQELHQKQLISSQTRFICQLGQKNEIESASIGNVNNLRNSKIHLLDVKFRFYLPVEGDFFQDQPILRYTGTAKEKVKVRNTYL